MLIRRSTTHRSKPGTTMTIKDVDQDFLRQEYFQLQKTVEDFDQRALTIKGWSVTASMAAIAAAFTQSAPALFLLASVSALLFWIIEALWKVFQQAYYPRLREIEDYMRGVPSEGFSSPDIVKSWSSAWRRTSLSRVMCWGHVCLPHVAIVVAGLLLWWYNFMWSLL
jgi:hypothetical protein